VAKYALQKPHKRGKPLKTVGRNYLRPHTHPVKTGENEKHDRTDKLKFIAQLTP